MRTTTDEPCTNTQCMVLVGVRVHVYGPTIYQIILHCDPTRPSRHTHTAAAPPSSTYAPPSSTYAPPSSTFAPPSSTACNPDEIDLGDDDDDLAEPPAAPPPAPDARPCGPTGNPDETELSEDQADADETLPKTMPTSQDRANSDQVHISSLSKNSGSEWKREGDEEEEDEADR